MKQEGNIIYSNDSRRTVDNFCKWTHQQAYNRMNNNGGYHFDVAVLLTRTEIGPAGGCLQALITNYYLYMKIFIHVKHNEVSIIFVGKFCPISNISTKKIDLLAPGFSTKIEKKKMKLEDIEIIGSSIL